MSVKCLQLNLTQLALADLVYSYDKFRNFLVNVSKWLFKVSVITVCIGKLLKDL